MSFREQLDVHVRARCTLIVLETGEEERAIEEMRAACAQAGWQCVAWDVAEGFSAITPGAALPSAARDPLTALEAIEKASGDGVFVLKDFHECWGNAQVKRKLRNVVQRLRYTRKSLIVTAPDCNVPSELADEVLVMDFPLPTAAELEGVLDRIAATPGLKVDLTDLGREKLVQAALGLTTNQAQRVFAKAIVSDGSLDERDIDEVTAEKKQIIRQSEALEYYSVTETPDDVGGLGVLKHWLSQRERAFTKEAADYGLPAPKGVALIGIPGTGKSLTAKMVGGLWRLPLLRLDVGALFGSLVGESEERVRQALKLAELVAPCIVWIDEMEKGLAHGGLDSGTSTRVFGTILTWMQEKTAPCFVVATANDISSLPPELLRRGRFDEVFFLDLPTLAERREIFEVHIRKRKRLPADFALDALAARSQGLVGAEIEQSVVDAMYAAFAERREFTTEDVLRALERLVPLSVSQREVIEGLREWLRDGRAQSASFDEAAQAQEQFVPLQFAQRPAAPVAPAVAPPAASAPAPAVEPPAMPPFIPPAPSSGTQA